MGKQPDSIEILDEILPMVDDEDEIVDLNLVARIMKDDEEYVVCLDPDDEEGVIIFHVSFDEEEECEMFEPVEDDNLNEDLFYLYDAHSERYEFCDAT